MREMPFGIGVEFTNQNFRKVQSALNALDENQMKNYENFIWKILSANRQLLKLILIKVPIISDDNELLFATRL